MWLRRLNFLNWSISAKLILIYLVAILLPIIIIVAPTVSQRRINAARAENRVRLATLGPYEITRIEQTLQSLTTLIERLPSTEPADRETFNNYLYLAPTTLSAERRDQLERQIELRIVRYLANTPGLTRMRLFGETGQLLMDATQQDETRIVSFGANLLGTTPADTMLQSSAYINTTTTDIYVSEQGHLSLDVILPFQIGFNMSGTPKIPGYLAVTVNLQALPPDSPLPDLYAMLQDFPQSEEQTHVFLLNRAGQLISPAPELDLLAEASQSEGFRAAQRGDHGVSSYYSPLLGEDVLGYHETVTFEDGPQITLLAETSSHALQTRGLQDVLFSIIAIVLGVTVIGLGAVLLGAAVIARPITRLTGSARRISAGYLDERPQPTTRQDEIGVLNNALAEMSDQLLNSITELEQRVAERTRNLELTLEIGRVLASIRDLDTLLEDVVNLIRDQFEQVYHVQVFLIDPQLQRAVLKASTGAIGRTLLERGHYLEVGSQSVIGSVTASGHAVVALDTSSNPIHRRNEFLPDTRAEMALPLRSGDRIIGALDLQSTAPDAFSEQDVGLFQGMADQITIAIENAILFAESNARLQQIENLNRLLTRANWQESLAGQEQDALVATAGPGAAPADAWSPLQREAMLTGQIADRAEGDTVTFAVPILLRGEVLGAVEWQVPGARYTQYVRQTALELTSRLALTAENIRLFEQGRRATQREQWVNQISSKLTGTTDIDQILQTAVRELGLVLRLPQTAIRLNPSNGQPAEAVTETSSE
ncbi:MAG: GAF domain-containing protein [Chloroflexi bacterium]|nr:GAF domain-containing protein [Chloroflexota bacterium]